MLPIKTSIFTTPKETNQWLASPPLRDKVSPISLGWVSKILSESYTLERSNIVFGTFEISQGKRIKAGDLIT